MTASIMSQLEMWHDEKTIESHRHGNKHSLAHAPCCSQKKQILHVRVRPNKFIMLICLLVTLTSVFCL